MKKASTYLCLKQRDHLGANYVKPVPGPGEKPFLYDPSRSTGFMSVIGGGLTGPDRWMRLKGVWEVRNQPMVSSMMVLRIRLGSEPT